MSLLLLLNISPKISNLDSSIAKTSRNSLIVTISIFTFDTLICHHLLKPNWLDVFSFGVFLTPHGKHTFLLNALWTLHFVLAQTKDTDISRLEQQFRRNS